MIPCPPAARWPGLFADELPADLGAHLDSCPHCQSALEASWADARQLLAPPAADERAAVERLKRPPDTLDANDTDEGDDAQDVLDRLGPSAHPGALGKWGPYDVLAVRGRGGMGVVLRAYDAELNREVALKIQAPRLAHGPAARKRFRREAMAAAAVRHENVVPIHAVAEFAGLPYLVMEYVDGPTLQERIDRDGPLPVDEVLSIGAKLAAGLAAAHAAGLVHRDLKPANVLLAWGGGNAPGSLPGALPPPLAKIADFGLARAADDPSLTATGVLCGTPAYMAPEQIVGDPVDWRADLYGLGGTLYALAVGRPPHAGATKLELLRQVCDGTVPSLRSIDPNIPVWLEEIVMTLLAKEPARRYKSATAVSELLEGCLAHRRTGAPLPPPLRHPPSRRSRFAIAAIIACTLLAGVVLKLQTPDGTLIVEIDDPSVNVSVDGSELTITGAGVQELRVKPGSHTVAISRNGKPTKDEVVTVTSGGKQVVRVTREVKPPASVSGDADRHDMRFMAAFDKAASAPRPPEHGRRFPLADTVTSLAFTPDGKFLVTGSADGAATVWDLATDKAVTRMAVRDPGPIAIAVSPDGTRLVLGGHNGTVSCLAFPSGETLWTAAVGQRRALVAYSPDGKFVAAAGQGLDDSSAALLDAATGKQVKAVKLDAVPVAVAFNPSGHEYTVGLADGKIVFVPVRDALVSKPRTNPPPVNAISYTPGNYDASGDRGLVVAHSVIGRLRLCLSLTDTLSWDVDISADPVVALAFRPQGRVFATAGATGALQLWDMGTLWNKETTERRPIATLTADGTKLRALAFSQDGRHLAAGGDDKTVRLWDVPNEPMPARR